MSHDPKTSIPVGVASAIARTFKKSIVVITAYEPETGLIHTVTYGTTAVQKLQAAALGTILAEAAGGDVTKSKYFEDFRTEHDAALFRELVEHVESSLDKGNEWEPAEWDAWNNKAKELVAQSREGGKS